MSRIVRFRLKSRYPEEETFLVKRVVRTTEDREMTSVTDDCGNAINAKHDQHSISRNVQEGISAVSLPSNTPAEVVILETSEGLTPEGKQEQAPDQRKPLNLGDYM